MSGLFSCSQINQRSKRFPAEPVTNYQLAIRCLLYEVPLTGDLVASPSDWAYFEELFTAFLLELPRDVNAQTAIGSAIYLAGRLGSKIKLRVKNEAAYLCVRATLTANEQEFIESLFRTDLNRPVELVQQLGVLNKLPSDFV